MTRRVSRSLLSLRLGWTALLSQRRSEENPGSRAHASQETPDPGGQFWLLLPWGHCRFPLGVDVVFAPSKLPSLFLLVLWRSCSQIQLAFSVRFPGGSQFLCCFPRLGSLTQNLHNSGRASLVLLFSSLWVIHPAGMGFDFIVFVPLLPSHCGFFILYMGYFFFLVGSSVFLLIGCSTGSCDFGALTGGDEHLSF